MIDWTRQRDLLTGAAPHSFVQETLWSLWEARAALQQVLIVTLALLSIVRGAAPERICTGTLLGMGIVDTLYHAWFGTGAKFLEIDIGHSLIDVAAFLVLAGTALLANRVYPLWLASLQLIAALAHLVRDISPVIAEGAYAVLIILPSYLEMVVAGLGLINHARRVRRHGPYRSWLAFSPTSGDRARRRPPSN